MLLFEYFMLTMCGFRVTHGQISPKPFTVWGNQNDHDDQQDQQMETGSKRSLFECGVHGQEPTIDSLSAETPLPGEWPWVVAVVRSTNKVLEFKCSASLIGNRFAISAADCIDRLKDRGRLSNLDDAAIIVGARDVSHLTYDEESTRFLTAMYRHEEYNRNAYWDNIALLVLKEQVTYSKLVKPVCLWEGEDDQDDPTEPIQHSTVVGWPYDGATRTLEALLQFNVSIISHTTCRELNMDYAEDVYEKTFCALTVSGRTIGAGFSGSGLFIKQHGRWVLRGMHMAYTLDTMISTTLYLDVAKYRNWISDTAYRWLQTNSLPPAPNTYAAGNNLSWTRLCSVRDEVVSLIYGGQSTREADWPWHVAIYHNEHTGNSSSIIYKCGGSLISPSHVLTAAHCLIDERTKRLISKRYINIFLGTNNIKSFSEGVQFKMVDRLEKHPEYNKYTHFKDIAVLMLSSPAEFTSTVRPVCLWPEDKVDLSNVVGKNGSVVGWGSEKNGLLAEDLKVAELPVVSELTCIRSNIAYVKYTNNFTFCAGLPPDTSVCTGDSGGGMVFKLGSGAGKEEWFLRGIVSLRSGTNGPCDPSRYVVYTDVAKYLDWIKNSVSLDMSLNLLGECYARRGN